MENKTTVEVINYGHLDIDDVNLLSQLRNNNDEGEI